MLNQDELYDSGITVEIKYAYSFDEAVVLPENFDDLNGEQTEETLNAPPLLLFTLGFVSLIIIRKNRN